MNTMRQVLLRSRRLLCAGIGRDISGQDLLEYALVAGFIAVFIGAMMPQQVVPALCCIYSKVNQVLVNYAGS
jgi:Flp pilus assembly pilin Flp